MASLSDFERFVLPFCAGAPQPAVQDAVLDASIEFCTRTRAARQVLDPISLVASTADYEIAVADDLQVVEVLGAWLPGRSVDPATRPDLDALYPDGWADLTVGSAAEVARFYCRAPGVIRLVPMLLELTALRLEVALAPTKTAITVPDILLSRYAEQIRDGALARLHQHAAPYADPQRAITYAQLFERHCTLCADDTQHGFAHQPLRTGRDEF